MSVSVHKCASCVGANGSCVNSIPSFNDLQGQVNVCPSAAGWNYGQSAVFQMRNMPAPSHGFLATTDPMSFDLANPERYRPFTHMPVAPQKLSNGAVTLNNEGLMGTSSPSSTSNLYPLSKGGPQMFAALPPGNFNSTYCGPDSQSCYYKDAMTRAGPARDGCVPKSQSCSTAMSNL